MACLTLSNNKGIIHERNFMYRLFLKADPINSNLAKHISNYYEIILTEYKEIILTYIEIINDYKDQISVDNMAVLYRGAIFPALKNKIQIAYLLTKIRYSYRCFREIANYYNYQNENGKAIYYLIKAIKTAPEELIEDYKKKRNDIIDKINAW